MGASVARSAQPVTFSSSSIPATGPRPKPPRSACQNPFVEQTGSVTGDAYFQADVLEDMAAAVNYHDWLVALGEPYLGDDPLEVGSGTGDYAAAFAARGHRITASEGFAASLRGLRSRFEGDGSVQVRELTVPAEVSGEYSAVLAYNVLEHIPDDAAAVRTFRDLVRVEGRVVLFVPAFQFAMSRFDRRVGHQRRYRVASLRKTLTDAGLVVERIHYVNSVGLLAWFTMMRLLRGTPRPSRVLLAWDQFVIPLLRRVESRWSPPFGQSILAVARRPADPRCGAGSTGCSQTGWRTPSGSM
jgi:SAM-dependent methyltransferase